MKRARSLVVNWKAVEGAAHGKRKLLLRKNEHNFYTCPVKLCLHADFKSSRGLRKHINNKHPWFYYFDEQPEVKREAMTEQQPNRKKAFTAKKPAFSLDEGIGQKFLQWLCTSCGGGKTNREAQQVGKRTMKFFMHSVGNNDDDIELTYEFTDCCLSSASILISFLKVLEEEWKLGSSGVLNYVKAIGDFVDFRKANGVSDSTLRCFAMIEVYLRRAKENLRKKKNLECNRNLDLETLIARDSWATIEEMEEVIPYHMKSFKTIIQKCTSSEQSRLLTRSDLVFCIRFITTVLFLRVKCSRPMTYQFLTISMIDKARSNDGFIDQTEFKTASKYIFDTLIISPDVMEIIDLYILHIRSRLNPQSDYLLLSTNGHQFQSLTTAMRMLVHQAIGKYINLTRYRQIIETESSERLTLEEQQYVSEDQKHSSRVAKIFYRKKQSKKVAIEGKKCVDKMTMAARSESNKNLMRMFNDIENAFDNTILEKSRQILEQGEGSDSSIPNSPYQPVNLEDSMDLTITTTIPPDQQEIDQSRKLHVPNDDVLIKKEVVNLVTKKTTKNIKFSKEEDKNLNDGIKKYGRRAWALILKDKEFSFHPSRTRDSLRVRADCAAFKKVFDTSI